MSLTRQVMSLTRHGHVLSLQAFLRKGVSLGYAGRIKTYRTSIKRSEGGAPSAAGTGVTRNYGHAPPLERSYAPRHTPTVGS